MKRVYVVVEGITEEKFVNELLVADFSALNVHLYPRLIGEARSRKKRGGKIQIDKILKDVGNFLKQESDVCCTTMIDYYGIDPDFPGKMEAKKLNGALNKAKCVEKAMTAAIVSEYPEGARRFIPYVQMHEFESLLFCSPDLLADTLDNPGLECEFRKIASAFPTPEDINDNVNTAPSKRIEKLFPTYDKTLHGILAVSGMNLDNIARQCPVFGDWLNRLKSLQETD
jgi:hypothetical protein